MLTSYKYELKSNENLNDKVKEELNITYNEYFAIENEVTKGLLKTKKIEIEVIKKEDIKECAKKYLNELFKLMNVSAQYEIKIDDNILKIYIISEDKKILIGKNGKTLDSISFTLKNVLKSNYYKFHVNLDIEDYKIKKQKRLEREIKNICQEVLKSKIEVSLDPMNSYERRLVHSIVSEYTNLISSSHGENKERYTIIKYKD